MQETKHNRCLGAAKACPGELNRELALELRFPIDDVHLQTFLYREIDP